MKKTYLIPTIETLEVRSSLAICNGTNNSEVQGDEGNVFVGGGNAPSRRKPF